MPIRTFSVKGFVKSRGACNTAGFSYFWTTRNRSSYCTRTHKPIQTSQSKTFRCEINTIYKKVKPFHKSITKILLPRVTDPVYKNPVM